MLNIVTNIITIDRTFPLVEIKIDRTFPLVEIKIATRLCCTPVGPFEMTFREANIPPLGIQNNEPNILEEMLLDITLNLTPCMLSKKLAVMGCVETTVAGGGGG